MTYSKTKLGAELLILLEDKASIDEISRWADKVFNSNLINYNENYNNENCDNILHSLSAMTLGEEFEYTKNDLLKIAHALINGEKISKLEEYLKLATNDDSNGLKG